MPDLAVARYAFPRMTAKEAVAHAFAYATLCGYGFAQVLSAAPRQDGGYDVTLDVGIYALRLGRIVLDAEGNVVSSEFVPVATATRP